MKDLMKITAAVYRLCTYRSGDQSAAVMFLRDTMCAMNRRPWEVTECNALNMPRPEQVGDTLSVKRDRSTATDKTDIGLHGLKADASCAYSFHPVFNQCLNTCLTAKGDCSKWLCDRDVTQCVTWRRCDAVNPDIAGGVMCRTDASKHR